MNPKGNPNIAKHGEETRFKAGCRAVVEAAHKGGNAFREKCEENKKFKRLYDFLLPRTVGLSPEQIEELRKSGIAEDEVSNEMLMVWASIKTAQIPNEKGTSERHNILETYGEAKTTQDINLNALTPFDFVNDTIRIREEDD